MLERDYIMRLVQQLSGVLARILKAREQEDYDKAQQDVDKAYGELFGLEPQLIYVWDSQTLAQLLGHWEKVKALATLVRQQAELDSAQGDRAAAERHTRRALELNLEALALRTEPDVECTVAVNELRSQVDFERLSERHRSLLAKLRP